MLFELDSDFVLVVVGMKKKVGMKDKKSKDLICLSRLGRDSPSIQTSRQP